MPDNHVGSVTVSNLNDGAHRYTVYFTVAISSSASFDISQIGVQIGNSEIQWHGGLVPAAGTYWVIADVGNHLPVGQSATVRIVVKGQTISDEVFTIEKFTITRTN